MANLERIYTIPFNAAYNHVRTKRGKRAIAIIRAFALRHMKALDTRISEGTNSAILRDGIEKPPRRLKVRIVKDENAVAKVWLIGEEEKIKEVEEKKKKSNEDAKKKQEETSKKKADATKKGEEKPVAKTEPTAPEAKKTESAKLASKPETTTAATSAKQAEPAKQAVPAKK